MAEGAGNQHPSINIFMGNILVISNDRFTVEGDFHYGDLNQIRTNIIDSNIETVNAGAAHPAPDVEQPNPAGAQHGPDEPDDQENDANEYVDEEEQQMNLARPIPPPKPPSLMKNALIKDYALKNAARVSRTPKKIAAVEMQDTSRKTNRPVPPPKPASLRKNKQKKTPSLKSDSESPELQVDLQV